jgi:hypothetical protein
MAMTAAASLVLFLWSFSRTEIYMKATKTIGYTANTLSLDYPSTPSVSNTNDAKNIKILSHTSFS